MRRFLIIIYKLYQELSKLELILIISGLIIALAILFVFFYVLISETESDFPRGGGILKIGLTQQIDTLNPVLAQNSSEKTIVNLIYDSLVRPDGNGGYEYELAQSVVPLDKGLKYEITLKDAFWSNGDKIEADDVLASIDYFRTYNPFTKNFLKNLKIEKIDNKKILVSLEVKDNFFIQRLSFIKIIPAKVFAQYGFNEWKANEKELLKVTSGPYVLSKNSTKNSIQIFEFLPNKYYSPQPKIDKIVVYVYPDFENAFIALKIKDINLLGGFKPTYTASLGKSYRTEKIILPRVIALFCQKEKLKTTLKNLASLIDRKYLIERIFDKLAEPAYSIFSPSLERKLKVSFTFPPTTLSATTSFENIEITVPNSFFMIKIGEYLNKNFNFKIKVENIDKINNEIIPEKKYACLLYGISYNLLPDLRIFFDPNSLFNLTQTSNPDILKRIQAIETGESQEISKQLQDLKELINKEEQIIFLVNPYYVYAVDNKIKNINISYLNDPNELFVKIEEWYFKKGF